jgi:hypothetical protein
MAHVRKSIRDNITTTLTGLTTTGSNVYQTRIYPLGRAKLPGLCVYTRTETTEYVTLGLPRTQIRQLEVLVEAYVKGTSSIDDTLDTVSVEIEEALYTDLTRGGYAKDTQVTSFEVDYDGDGEQSIGVARFTILVTYATLENDIEAAA